MTVTDTGNVKLAIARRRADARLIRIRDALTLRASGHPAEYACPYCEARVFTVDTSTDRAVHFRHEHGVECAATSGLETWLHHQAKKAFSDRKEIRLPPVDGYVGEVRSFTTVALEKNLQGSSLRPDAIAQDIRGEIAVEFAVTHFCEVGKQLEFMQRKLPAIEVDLSAAPGPVEDMSQEELEDWILFQAPRIWIASPAMAEPEPEIIVEDIPEIETSPTPHSSSPVWGRDSTWSSSAFMGEYVVPNLKVSRSRQPSPSASPEIENAKLHVARRATDFHLVPVWTALTFRDAGQAAEYNCPYCREPVEPVSTFMATGHFRHQEGVRCPGKGGGAEEWLHWQARKTFRDRKEILLPPLDDDGVGDVRAFSSVFVNKHIYMSSIRPDAIAVVDQGELAVEFAVVKCCSPARVIEYQKRDYTAIEVNLMASDLYDMPPDQLDDWILFKAPRKWISRPQQASSNMLYPIPDVFASRWARNGIDGFGI